MIAQQLGEMTLQAAELRIAVENATPRRAGALEPPPGEPVDDGIVRANSGDVLQVGLEWRAERSPEANYTVFVQLLDANQQVVVQRDRWPGDGLFPTSQMASGEVITDSLAIPLDLPPGRYQLITGLYRTDVEGAPRLAGPGGDYIEVAEIEIIGG
jgi:hypothetical protein